MDLRTANKPRRGGACSTLIPGVHAPCALPRRGEACLTRLQIRLGHTRSQARRKRSTLPTYRTKWKERKTNDQAIHPMDSAAGSNCANRCVLSSVANGGDACSRACCPGSTFSNYSASWSNAGLFQALVSKHAHAKSRGETVRIVLFLLTYLPRYQS